MKPKLAFLILLPLLCTLVIFGLPQTPVFNTPTSFNPTFSNPTTVTAPTAFSPPVTNPSLFPQPATIPTSQFSQNPNFQNPFQTIPVAGVGVSPASNLANPAFPLSRFSSTVSSFSNAQLLPGLINQPPQVIQNF
ncbi:hypothetical protein HMI56_003325, partial [Coelomomyces lativittatus]